MVIDVVVVLVVVVVVVAKLGHYFLLFIIVSQIIHILGYNYARLLLNSKRSLSDIWLLKIRKQFWVFKKNKTLIFSKNTHNFFAYYSATKFRSEAVLYFGKMHIFCNLPNIIVLITRQTYINPDAFFYAKPTVRFPLQ